MTSEELKSMRLTAGWTQKYLAKRLRVSQPSVSQWESGKAPIDGRTEIAIRTVLQPAATMSLDRTRKVKTVSQVGADERA